MKTSVEIELDGSKGEGGGQILRSALSLSAITGKSFRLNHIRAGRQRPGLMRQHLTCVQAAAEICGAKLSDVTVGTKELRFTPGAIAASDATFAIGTAGSVSLVAQTILPILWFADGSSEVTLRGGTHALKSPSIDYLDEIYLPQVECMGAKTQLEVIRAGFFPAGGGEVKLSVSPSKLEPIERHERHDPVMVSAEVISTSEIPDAVAEKEFASVERKIPLTGTRVTDPGETLCPGNVLILRAEAGPEGCPGTLVSANGDKGKRATKVAQEAIGWMKRYLNSPSPVDEFLADQLLLPLAIAGGGGFTAAKLTAHFDSNVEVIESFLPVKIHTQEIDRFASKIDIESL